jgi:hypothetical protein
VELRVIAVAVRPWLTHTASYERNAVTERSPTNQRLPASYELVAADLACQYWEPETTPERAHAGLHEGPNVVLVLLGPRMLVATDADIRVGDVVTSIRSGAGVITGDRMRVTDILWRQTHQEVALEQLSTGPVQEPGS